MILLDRCLDRTLQPFSVRRGIQVVELIVDSEGHVSEEGRLRSAEVVTSAAVEDLSVVFDLKYEMLDHAFGYGNFAIDEESKDNEVRIPVVELSHP